MAAEQKHSHYILEAESRLRELSPKKLQLALAFLAYLQETGENEIQEKLLNIPGFASSLSETNNSKEKVGDTQSNLIAEDAEVWQAYLAVEQQWEEVFRRLADS